MYALFATIGENLNAILAEPFLSTTGYTVSKSVILITSILQFWAEAEAPKKVLTSTVNIVSVPELTPPVKITEVPKGFEVLFKLT